MDLFVHVEDAILVGARDRVKLVEGEDALRSVCFATHVYSIQKRIILHVLLTKGEHFFKILRFGDMQETC